MKFNGRFRQLGVMVMGAMLVAMTVSSVANADATIYATVSNGNPCAAGNFDVAFHIEDNDVGEVGTYAFEITWNPVFTFLSGTVCDLGGIFDANDSANTVRVTGGNANSTLQNGCLFTLTFSSPGGTPDPVDIITSLVAFGSTPLYTNWQPGFLAIPFTFDTTRDNFDCPAESWLWGDVNADGVTGTVDAALILQYDAFLIFEFPCCPETFPDFPVRGDVNGDNVLGTVDAALILQYDAFLIFCFEDVDLNCDGFGPEN